jgi:soluble lytic murein transglycosylase-like protein
MEAKSLAFALSFCAIIYSGARIVAQRSSGYPFVFEPQSQQYADAIKAAEEKNGVPFGLLASLLRQESGFNKDAFNAESGAMGIAQFLAGTAKDMNINPYDPYQSIDGAARYLVVISNYLGGSAGWRDIIGAYNWGMGNMRQYLRGGGGAPPLETQIYMAKVYDSWNLFSWT